MPIVRSNGLDLWWEERGLGTPLVLIMGLGAQLVLWPDGLVDGLVARGFRVIRFDNRDVGKSTWLREAGLPNVRAAIARRLAGMAIDAPYTLSDMARDTIGLLDALGIERAHLVGASMGGMIGQHLALEHADRVASLTSIMSTGGERRSLVVQPRVLATLLAGAPGNREAYLERYVDHFRVLAGRGFPYDAEKVRTYAERQWDRGVNPHGFARQLTAVLASGSRYPALSSMKAPTLVIHGTDDPLVPITSARRMSEAVPGARFVPIEGMGHDLPAGVWERVAGLVQEHVARA